MKPFIAALVLAAWIGVAFTGSVAALLLLALPVAVAVGSACGRASDSER
jgi:hypothetical protein